MIERKIFWWWWEGIWLLGNTSDHSGRTRDWGEAWGKWPENPASNEKEKSKRSRPCCKVLGRNQGPAFSARLSDLRWFLHLVIGTVQVVSVQDVCFDYLHVFYKHSKKKKKRRKRLCYSEVSFIEHTLIEQFLCSPWYINVFAAKECGYVTSEINCLSMKPNFVSTPDVTKCNQITKMESCHQ